MTRNIAICFFGITRSLAEVLPSIETCILAPARALGQVTLYAHLYEQDRIDSPRSGEQGEIAPDDYRLLNIDRLIRERPGPALERWDFETLRTYGDFWDNDFSSLRNLVHQLHSLHCVTGMALEDAPDLCLFVRPDLRYHDSLGPTLSRALKGRGDRIYLPRWQPWFGYNDRFAAMRGARAMRAYGQRIEQARAYCEERAAPLHSERMLKFAVDRAGIPVTKITPKASRVRLGGLEVEEDFTAQWGLKAQRVWQARLKPVLRPAARLARRAFGGGSRR